MLFERILRHLGLWQEGVRKHSSLSRPCSAARAPWRRVDFRAHFCHSATMETHAFGFRLRANAPEGQKRSSISPP
jgi:hypothetical protein